MIPPLISRQSNLEGQSLRLWPVPSYFPNPSPPPPLFYKYVDFIHIVPDNPIMACFEEKGDCIVLNVRVVPRAAKDEIHGLLGEALKVRIQAPPVEGKANAYLIRFLSKHWKIPRADMEIISGETGRNKRLRIFNPPEAIRRELASLEHI